MLLPQWAPHFNTPILTQKEEAYSILPQKSHCDISDIVIDSKIFRKHCHAEYSWTVIMYMPTLSLIDIDCVSICLWRCYKVRLKWINRFLRRRRNISANCMQLHWWISIVIIVIIPSHRCTFLLMLFCWIQYWKEYLPIVSIHKLLQIISIFPT